MITTQQNLQNHLNDGSITQEEYNEYYPYDGMEGSYYSVFVETDLNKASTIDGQRLSSEDAIAGYIASTSVHGWFWARRPPEVMMEFTRQAAQTITSFDVTDK